MANKSTVKAIPLTTIASSTLTGTYQAINALGLGFPCFVLRLNSTSTTAVTVSYDGTTDHEFLLNGATLQIMTQTNSNVSTNAMFSASTKVYVKGTAGTGNIYLSGYYLPQGV